MKAAWYKAYLQPAFLICVLVLASAGGGMSFAKKKLKIFFEKEPLPLKKSLALLDKNALEPYKVLSEQKIGYEEVVRVLGTDKYIQWVLEDTEAAADSPVRYCSLFVTYYEIADKRVAHVPDECYMGAGYQRSGDGEILTFEVQGDGIPPNVAGMYLVFTGTRHGEWQEKVEFPVLYLLNVNGRYARGRTDARVIMNKNLFNKYSYYSKVEWKFFNRTLGQTVHPSKEKVISASEKLLSVVLPILQKEHWPDWSVVDNN